MSQMMESLEKLVKAVNDCKWDLALSEACSLENNVRFDLLTKYCQPNVVQGKFEELKVYLIKPIRSFVKMEVVSEVIADILNETSVYGMGIGRMDFHDINKLAYMLENICGQIDLTLPVLCEERRTGAKIEAITAIKNYLNALERGLKGVRSLSNRSEIIELSEIALDDIRLFKARMNNLARPDVERKDYREVTDMFANLSSSVGKLSRMLREPDEIEILSKVFEDERGIKLSRGIVEAKFELELEVEKEREKEKVERAESKPGEFDWVDDDWKNILRHPTIYLIIGDRDTGKTALGWVILEYLAKEFNIKPYLFVTGDVPPRKLGAVPKWVSVVDSLKDIPNNCVVLVDEAYMRYHARQAARSYEAITLHKLIELSRQKGLTFIYVSQRSSTLDVNVIKAFNVLLIKKPSVWQIPYERELIKGYCEKALDKFNSLKRIDNPREWVYIVSDIPGIPRFEGFKQNGLPSFWSDELSKFYEEW